jgi:D-3-phosphoglycerate dehydrogenase
MGNVIATPHTAALTRDVVIKLAEGAAENAINVLEGENPTYSANWEIVQSNIGEKQ